MARIHHGFSPIVSDHSQILILGTFPGKISREKNQYYGNPRNALWRILSEILRYDLTLLDYTQKIIFLQSSPVAIWDVIACCETEGSLDSEIQKEHLVDLNAFLMRYSAIRAVAFNGGNSARYAKKLGKLSALSLALPSTSPANARLRYEQKLQIWRSAFAPYLDLGV